MTHEDIVAEDLRDLELDSKGHVQIGQDNDLKVTHGLDTVKQSVWLNTSSVVAPLIGEPIQAGTLEDIETEIRDILQEDPQLSDVNRVDVTEINRDQGTVSVEVFVGMNNSFEVSVDAT